MRIRFLGRASTTRRMSAFSLARPSYRMRGPRETRYQIDVLWEFFQPIAVGAVRLVKPRPLIEGRAAGQQKFYIARVCGDGAIEQPQGSTVTGLGEARIPQHSSASSPCAECWSTSESEESGTDKAATADLFDFWNQGI